MSEERVSRPGRLEMPPDQLSYAQAVEELNGIISELDSGLVDVDTLTVRFQRAIDIVEDLDGRIRRARSKVEELAPRLDAVTRAGSEGASSTPPSTPSEAGNPGPTGDGDELF